MDTTLTIIEDDMHSQKIYHCEDETLLAEQLKCLEILYDFNKTRPSEIKQRNKILNKFLGTVGKDCYIQPPLHASWGKHTHIGDNVYANFNLTLIDDTHITIGDNVMIGPNVTLSTAGHPIDPDLRKQQKQFNIPINIGNNAWVGAGVIILPGINIGENTVIGAGSIVTKDIPPNVVAVGNPCKVLRKINERDKTYYYKNLQF